MYVYEYDWSPDGWASPHRRARQWRQRWYIAQLYTLDAGVLGPS
jgi:hypothetical protein